MTSLAATYGRAAQISKLPPTASGGPRTTQLQHTICIFELRGCKSVISEPGPTTEKRGRPGPKARNNVAF